MGCPACRYMPTRADLPDGGETNKTMISLGGRAGVGAIQGKCGAPLGLGSCQAPPPRHESNARKPRCSSPDGRPMAPRSTATHRPAQNTLKGNLGAYTTVDFSFGIKKDQWDIEAFATNLFDERGIVNTGVQCLEPVCGTGVTPATPTGGAFYDTIIKPRIIGIKFSRDF